MVSKYIVMESAAQVRGKMAQFGRYRRIAVCEVEEGKRPAMISERARGMVRIVEEWSPMHQGKTERSEYYVARKAAEEMAAELNAQPPESLSDDLIKMVDDIQATARKGGD